jgi:hypothetical protein
MTTIDKINELSSKEIISVEQNGTQIEIMLDDGSVLVFYGMKVYSSTDWANMMDTRLASLENKKIELRATADAMESEIISKTVTISEYKKQHVPVIEIKEEIIVEPEIKEKERKEDVIIIETATSIEVL